VRHQVEEITGAGITPGEDDDLEAEAQRLGNAEDIAGLLAEALQLVGDLSEDSGELVARLRKVAQLDPGSESLPGRGEELAALISELMAELRAQTDGLEADPRRALEVEERLTVLGDLKRKYGRTLAEITAFGEAARTRLAELEELVAAASGIEEAVRKSTARVEATSGVLTEARQTAAAEIVGAALTHLTDLGMGGAVLEFDLQSRSPGPRGADQAQLLFSSDPRLELGPVASVASGGELSRLALALGLATRSAVTPTVVFDEVDAGIGGVTALAMGRKLASLATDTQVLCVTHLPQIAAHADRHYVVRSAGEAAVVEEMVGEERLTEISRMLAGLPDSEAGQEAAAELLAAAQSGE
jgi:DNA repair protein RecN (Recombination protein N)